MLPEKLLVLVIEDNEEIRENLETILETEYEVLVAADGQAGVELALSRRPDLILCDRMMPGMSGDEVLQVIHGQLDPRFKLTPFIFLTAKARSSEIRNGMSSGAWDYLTKPFTRDQLFKSIRTQLNRHKEAQKLMNLEVESGKRQARQEILLELPDQLSNPLNQIFLSLQLLSDEEDATERQQLIADGLAAATNLYTRLAAYFSEVSTDC